LDGSARTPSHRRPAQASKRGLLSHDQLTHRFADRFVQQPPREAIVSAVSGGLLAVVQLSSAGGLLEAATSALSLRVYATQQSGFRRSAFATGSRASSCPVWMGRARSRKRPSPSRAVMTVTGTSRFVTSRQVSSQPLPRSREEGRENDFVLVIRGDGPAGTPRRGNQSRLAAQSPVGSRSRLRSRLNGRFTGGAPAPLSNEGARCRVAES
jgi:hypothetical protein